jgi:aminopeptidase YwaD
MRSLIVAVTLLAAATANRQVAQPSSSLPPSASRAYDAIKTRVDGDSAMNVVRFMDQYWRIAGNPGFNASIDYIHSRVQTAGLASRVEEYPGRARGWDYTVGTVAFADDGEVVLSRQRDRVSLCINSFSTPSSGVEALLVDVGSGATSQDYARKSVKGAIVLGSAEPARLWREAVVARGAIGIISTSIASYVRPADPRAFTSADQQDVLQWGSIPYDATIKGFGFKASWRAASRLRERLANGPVRLKVDVQSAFYDGPSRMLIAEIPGSRLPNERVVMVAHVQEPGANDDGSGCGTLLALAAALSRAIADGALPRPGRTLTFIWADEVAGSRRWLTAHADQAKGTQYMFALDMTGEDTAKTGGTFLIEKQPDPSAVWPRPSDPHTAWGASPVSAGSLRGSLLNDVHLAICRRRAAETGWIVKTNPYEGGSDHTAFAEAGIPSLLNWHFTDRYYHTNLDRPDKTSTAEMINVAVAVSTSAWFLASATAADAVATVDLIAHAAADRLALERRQGSAIVAGAADRAAAETTERQVVAAWTKWYAEALRSVARLPVERSSPELSARIDAAVRALE